MKTLAIGLMTLMCVAPAGRADAADQAKGKAVFDVFCKGCHAPLPAGDGARGAPGGAVPAGTYVLQERYKGRIPAALEERPGLTPDVIRTAVRRGVSTPRKPEAPGTIMPPIRKTEITDEDLDDLVAYLTRPKK